MDRWIREFVKSKGMDIDEKEASLLYEHLGNNLSRISSELEKLTVNIQPRKKIEATDIETFIGISREYNVFELQKAMGSKEFVKVNKILKHFADDPGNNPFPLTLAILFGYFQ
jgi:DNA polymerase-3 subunit delta